MKNKLKYIYKGIAIGCLLLIANGCDDYLSTLPDNRSIIDSQEKVNDLLTGAYPTDNYQEIAEIMSDNADDTGDLGSENTLNLALYKWENSSLEGIDSPTGYWNSCYKAISQANQALASIKELEAQRKNETVDFSPQKGEALLARAYAHFMLVTFWGKAYNPKTATTDLGVPYLLEPEDVLLKKYKRNTVQENYDFIEKDLLEGIKLVQDDYNQPKFHFTKETGYAFAARFYLYKGNWDKVIEYTSKILVNPANEIRDLVSQRSFTYSELKRTYSSSSESTNLLLVSTISWWYNNYYGSRFGLSVSVENNLFKGNVGNPFGKSWAYRIFGIDFSRNLPKYDKYFKYSNLSAGIGHGYIGIVLFSKDEALLNRAEAYAMKKDYANALQDLTIFLSKKTINYTASDILTEKMITDTYSVKNGEFSPFYAIEPGIQASLIKAVSELKRREFYHEGLRWFDVKRYHLEVTHKLVGKKNMVLTKNDPRRELQIPLTAQTTLTPNPR